jgi:hypothetical protein
MKNATHSVDLLCQANDRKASNMPIHRYGLYSLSPSFRRSTNWQKYPQQDFQLDLLLAALPATAKRNPK